ncbi:MAG: DUF1127 domain-containing protein [Rhodospirillales bacterium]|nr:DUF1127 domain-containing protein [Rhodospirillales bacterium]
MHTILHASGSDRVDSAFGRRWPRSFSPLGLVAGIFACLLVWQDRASQRYALAVLDDHQLRDIGLTRSDVARESAKPFWRV